MIQSITITGGQSGPHLLITGGVHGDEWEPMAAIRRLKTLVHPESLTGTLTLAPVVNEPAFERAQRVAEDGLDLARTCPGDESGSTTQRIAAELSRLIRSADFYIDLHTGGRLYDILPLAGYMLHPDPSILNAQRRMARAFNLPLIWGTNPNFDGRSLSVARDVPIPGLYCELGGPAFRPDGVEAYAQGCLNVMGELKMLERPAPPERIKWVVEDGRDQSGHLQIQHPAQADGFFEPSAKLGDMVRVGDVIGTLSDVLGNAVQQVHAAQDGVLLLLRTVSSVKKSDALAAIAAQ
jgi:predicted deacylase